MKFMMILISGLLFSFYSHASNSMRCVDEDLFRSLSHNDHKNHQGCDPKLFDVNHVISLIAIGNLKSQSDIGNS